MNWKIIVLRVIVGLYLLPGLLFDLCVGFAFMLTDGRYQNKLAMGNQLGEWVFGLANLIPHWYSIPFMISVWICALPAGVIVLAVFLGLLFGICYCFINIIIATLAFPFSGRWEWGLLWKH